MILLLAAALIASVFTGDRHHHTYASTMIKTSTIIPSSSSSSSSTTITNEQDKTNKSSTTSAPSSSSSASTTKLAPLCAPELSDQCQCTSSGKEYSCRAAGFTTIPETIPSDIMKLDLTSNNITEIIEHSFSRFTELEELNFVFRPFLYAMLSSAQLLVYCFGGQMITDQSASVANATFEGCWWKLPDKSYRGGLIMMIQRSQREVNISAGGVYILSMDLYMKILRACVSFMTLLKNSINVEQ